MSSQKWQKSAKTRKNNEKGLQTACFSSKLPIQVKTSPKSDLNLQKVAFLCNFFLIFLNFLGEGESPSARGEGVRPVQYFDVVNYSSM